MPCQFCLHCFVLSGAKAPTVSTEYDATVGVTSKQLFVLRIPFVPSSKNVLALAAAVFYKAPFRTPEEIDLRTRHIRASISTAEFATEARRLHNALVNQSWRVETPFSRQKLTKLGWLLPPPAGEAFDGVESAGFHLQTGTSSCIPGRDQDPNRVSQQHRFPQKPKKPQPNRTTASGPQSATITAAAAPKERKKKTETPEQSLCSSYPSPGKPKTGFFAWSLLVGQQLCTPVLSGMVGGFLLAQDLLFYLFILSFSSAGGGTSRTRHRC